MSLFRPNPAFHTEVEANPRFHLAMRHAAQAVADTAERFAKQAGGPWLPRSGSGTNKSYVVAQQEGDTAVVGQDHAAHLIEWGSVNNPPHAPLRRAVRAEGLELK